MLERCQNLCECLGFFAKKEEPKQVLTAEAAPAPYHKMPDPPNAVKQERSPKERMVAYLAQNKANKNAKDNRSKTESLYNKKSEGKTAKGKYVELIDNDELEKGRHYGRK